jgi:hypothetical protein
MLIQNNEKRQKSAYIFSKKVHSFRKQCHSFKKMGCLSNDLKSAWKCGGMGGNLWRLKLSQLKNINPFFFEIINLNIKP